MTDSSPITSRTQRYGDRTTGTTFEVTVETGYRPYDDLAHVVVTHDKTRVAVTKDDRRVQLLYVGGEPVARLTVEEARCVANALHTIAACVEAEEVNG
jgi:hypothetical protein